MKDNSGPAFPIFEPNQQWDDRAGKYKNILFPTGGMSLRQWYAGKQMAAYRTVCLYESSEKIAEWALADADALIAVLKKEQT